ncbi:predicted protein [Histoplasma capsulatum G186AR]|uniref:Uncharacterized protein n=1 Tax=Ajellomyces capsulatus (strain G186AR / H82 / ATCC MYA-2454 / RMSCC 2432) TaxID=447093 RepID=C0P029_AJECG|nr:uncharacterized protein HCBG_08759 [Histoplasma capsulatum G186AR]EEH03119.1 predicted protein [Histoplasma capsulatum G186AR]
MEAGPRSNRSRASQLAVESVAVAGRRLADSQLVAAAPAAPAPDEDRVCWSLPDTTTTTSGSHDSIQLAHLAKRSGCQIKDRRPQSHSRKWVSSPGTFFPLKTKAKG